MISFVVTGIPQTKGSWKIVGGRRGYGRLVPDNEAEPAWAELIAWAAKAQMHGRAPTRDRVMVSARFYLPAPPNRRKTNRRDLDKLARSALDAMQGIVYVDDEQVDDLILRKRVAENSIGIGASISVELSTP